MYGRMRITPDDQLGFRALTVKQPFAGQILAGTKPIEFRSWSTDYRGDMLISASSNPRTQGPFACAVCVVRLVDVRDPGEPDDFEWVLEDPRPVKNVTVKGALGLWTVSRELTIKLGITWD
jgi:hypothetical protein